MGSIDQLNHSVSLDSAATDFRRYVKTEAKRVLLTKKGFYFDSFQLAMAEKGVGSRLRTMFEMPDGIFADYAKMMVSPIDADPEQTLSRGAERANQLEMRMKAAVAVGGIDTGTWGSQLAPFAQSSVAFLETLSPYDSFDRLLADRAAYPLPLRYRVAVATTAAVGYAAGEDVAKPVSSMAFAVAQQPALKAQATVVLNNEVILETTPAANRLFEIEVAKGVAKATDAAFLGKLSAGAGNTRASTGLTAAQFQADVDAALNLIQIDNPPKLYLILPLSTYKHLVLLRDGSPLLVNGKINGLITVLPSSAATTEGFLLEASTVGCDSDLVTPESTTISTEATLEMADNPTATDWHLISLWQQNWTAIRFERFFGATVLRSGVGICKITGYS
jgi:hypothetical protein